MLKFGNIRVERREAKDLISRSEGVLAFRVVSGRWKRVQEGTLFFEHPKRNKTLLTRVDRIGRNPKSRLSILAICLWRARQSLNCVLMKVSFKFFMVIYHWQEERSRRNMSCAPQSA